MGLPWDAYYVLTKANARLVNSKLHPNSGAPDYNITHLVSGLTGDTDDLTEGGTNLYYTDARVETLCDGLYLSLDGEATNVTNGTFDLTTTGTATLGKADIFEGTPTPTAAMLHIERDSPWAEALIPIVKVKTDFDSTSQISSIFDFEANIVNPSHANPIFASQILKGKLIDSDLDNTGTHSISLMDFGLDLSAIGAFGALPSGFDRYYLGMNLKIADTVLLSVPGDMTLNGIVMNAASTILTVNPAADVDIVYSGLSIVGPSVNDAAAGGGTLTYANLNLANGAVSYGGAAQWNINSQSTLASVWKGDHVMQGDDVKIAWGAAGAADSYIQFGGDNLEYHSAGQHDFLNDDITTTANIWITGSGNRYNRTFVGKNYFGESDNGAIYSQADGYLDMHALTEIRLGDSVAGAPSNYSGFNPTGDLVFYGGAGLPHGDIYGLDETITCTNQSTWYQVTFDTAGPSNNTTVTVANDEITVLKTGAYHVGLTACCHSASAHDFELMAKKNNGSSDITTLHLFQSTAVAGQVENISGNCNVSLSANDTIEAWVQCTDAAGIPIILDHIDLNITQIGGT